MTRRRLLAIAACARKMLAAERHAMAGIVLTVDAARRSFTASCAEVPGYMKAMVMPFSVRDAKALDGVAPGASVEFTLVVDADHSYAEGIQIRHFESMDQEALRARRLQLLQSGPQPPGMPIGNLVPDFTLTDQTGQRVRLSQFRGKVVALTFIYTSCPLPDYCLRLSNNFGRLAKRFTARDVALLSITFDPVHDTPKVLARYEQRWKADPKLWRLLTGDLTQIKTICRNFGLNFWQDEGLLTHSLKTAVIDRTGKLAGVFEGNEFTAEQLGDFVAMVAARKTSSGPH